MSPWVAVPFVVAAWGGLIGWLWRREIVNRRARDAAAAAIVEVHDGPPSGWHHIELRTPEYGTVVAGRDPMPPRSSAHGPDYTRTYRVFLGVERMSTQVANSDGTAESLLELVSLLGLRFGMPTPLALREARHDFVAFEVSEQSWADEWLLLFSDWLPHIGARDFDDAA